jgi:hypothetical protein
LSEQFDNLYDYDALLSPETLARKEAFFERKRAIHQKVSQNITPPEGRKPSKKRQD